MQVVQIAGDRPVANDSLRSQPTLELGECPPLKEIEPININKTDNTHNEDEHCKTQNGETTTFTKKQHLTSEQNDILQYFLVHPPLNHELKGEGRPLNILKPIFIISGLHKQ